jgi:hypothetical protein
VFEQMLSSFGGAGGGLPCDPEESGIDIGRLDEPTIAIGTDQRPNFAVLEVAEPIQLCLWRFAPGRPIDVTVRYPGGRIAESAGDVECVADDCWSHVNWVAVPGDPLGDHRVTAVQGQLRAEGTVKVVAATKRHLLVVGNGASEGAYQTFKRGQTIRVAAAGYGPGRGVELFVYYTRERMLQRSGRPLRFWTWIQLHADRQGGVTYSLRTAVGDPPGCYALDTRPKPQTVLRIEEPDPQGTYLNVMATEPLFCLA